MFTNAAKRWDTFLLTDFYPIRNISLQEALNSHKKSKNWKTITFSSNYIQWVSLRWRNLHTIHCLLPSNRANLSSRRPMRMRCTSQLGA